MRKLEIECEGFYTTVKGNNILLELDYVDLRFLTDIKIDEIVREFGVDEVLDSLLQTDADYVQDLLFAKGYRKVDE